ncbi:N-acetyltransferase [bacterium]|nr:N-acetyltransferase [bacterium]
MTTIHKTTQRLIIRPFEKEDFTSWSEAHRSVGHLKNHFDLAPRNPEELTPEIFDQILTDQAANREKGELFDLGAFCREKGTLLGGVSLMDIRRIVVFNTNIGYRFFNQHWGKGYAKEAVDAAIDIAFTQLALHRVEAAIEPDNFRSIRLAEKVGLRLEGFKRRFLHLRNGWRDCLIYAITSEERNIEHPGRETTVVPNLRW